MLPDSGWVTATLALMGFFLVGVGVGKMIAHYRSDGRGRTLWLKLVLAGGGAVAVAAALNLSRHFLKLVLLTHFGLSAWANMVITMTDVRHKTPPVVAYALFYGGMGVALVGLFGLLRRNEGNPGPLERGVRLAAVIGRASFVSYVSQQWLIDFVPLWVGFETWLTPPVATVSYLLLTTFAVFWIARVWDRCQANRYLTVGLKSLPRQPSPSSNRAIGHGI
jgi:multidrug transporter EmrE-like cation transporter